MNNKKYSKLTCGLFIVSVSMLSGCASAPQKTNTPPLNIGSSTLASTINASMGVGRVVFQAAVNRKCNVEIEKNTLWKTAKLVMTSNKQEQMKYNVCNCVSIKSTEGVTLDQLIIAATSQQSRNILVQNSVSNALSGCYGEVVKTIIQQ